MTVGGAILSRRRTYAHHLKRTRARASVSRSERGEVSGVDRKQKQFRGPKNRISIDAKVKQTLEGVLKGV